MIILLCTMQGQTTKLYSYNTAVCNSMINFTENDFYRSMICIQYILFDVC